MQQGDRSSRFVLIRLDERNWEIHEQTPTRVGGLIAHITAGAGHVSVCWEFPTMLPVRYSTPEDVLLDIRLLVDRPPRATKPVPIPHFPPLRN